MSKKLIAALDTADLATARAWASALAPHCGALKLGLEFFLAHGPAGVEAIGRELPVFLDLKLHDIPNTVAGAVRSILPIAPAMMTLHASGGGAMIAAARKVIDQASVRPKLLAVTVLTSLDAAGLRELGIDQTPAQMVLKLARTALTHGADGVVCSAHEVAMLRAEFGSVPILVVPGIRPAGADVADQARTMTPGEAVRAGADFLVVGRPITQAADPGAAAARIEAEIAAAITPPGA
jgi:orotidine-5'-phosphate decarboxylase